MATPQERIVSLARSQVGYAANSDKTNKYAQELDALGIYNGPKNGFDWCDIFADWLFIEEFGCELGMKMLNQPMGGGGAGCWLSAGYHRDADQWSWSPQIGAQIYFGAYGDECHTGVVIDYDEDTVTTVEGNTGYSDGYSGGAVLMRTYSRDSSWIVGYGVPKWALVEGGWVRGTGKSSGKWWYRNPDGTYPASCWMDIDGQRYHFDRDGWLQSGWLKDGENWFYLWPVHDGHFGEMCRSTCIEDGGRWYAFGPDGAMLTEIQTNGQHDGTFGALELA